MIKTTSLVALLYFRDTLLSIPDIPGIISTAQYTNYNIGVDSDEETITSHCNDPGNDALSASGDGGSGGGC